MGSYTPTVTRLTKVIFPSSHIAHAAVSQAHLLFSNATTKGIYVRESLTMEGRKVLRNLVQLKRAMKSAFPSDRLHIYRQVLYRNKVKFADGTNVIALLEATKFKDVSTDVPVSQFSDQDITRRRRKPVNSASNNQDATDAKENEAVDVVKHVPNANQSDSVVDTTVVDNNKTVMQPSNPSTDSQSTITQGN